MEAFLNATSCSNLGPDKEPVAIAFGVCLALGVFCSYIPQQIKIVARRSSAGISFLYLVAASFQNYASTLNVVMVSMPQLVCCDTVSAGRCGELLLPVFQIGSPVFQLLVLYVLFLVFHQGRSGGPAVDEGGDTLPPASVQTGEQVEVMRETQSFSGDSRFGAVWRWLEQREFALSLAGFIFYILVALCTFSAVGLIIDLEHGYGSPEALQYARAMGFLAVALNIAQWSPQIYVTARNQHVGSLSIIMLALQTPGGLLIVFYNAFLDPSDWSTWLPFVFSSAMQFILLVMCIVFAYRDWKRRKLVEQHLSENAPLLSSD